MNHFLPEALRAESAFSILVHAGAVSDDPAVRNLAKFSFRRAGVFLYSLPCRLSTWHQVLADTYGPVERVLADHTCIPAFAAGMDASSVAQGIAQLRCNDRDRTTFPRLIPALLECGNRYGLRCRACEAEAKAAAGRDVSFIWHCFPFVSRCPRHGELLCVEDESSTYEGAMFAPGRDGTRRNSKLYAMCAYALLASNLIGDRRSACLKQLAQYGYQFDDGRWNIPQFTHDWQLAVRAQFEDVRLCALAASADFPRDLLRGAARTDRALHPARLALLNWFIAHQAQTAGVVLAKRAELPKRSGDASYRHGAAGQSPRAYRTQWLGHCAAHPGATQTELKLGLCSVWTWLYRHDKAWLWRHQPSKGQRGAKLDGVLAACLRVPTVPEHDRRGVSHLGTAYQQRVRLGVTRYALGRLSQFSAALRERCVSRDRLALRRVAHVKQALTRDEENLSLSVLARLASLRQATLRHALNHAAGEVRT